MAAPDETKTDETKSAEAKTDEPTSDAPTSAVPTSDVPTFNEATSDEGGTDASKRTLTIALPPWGIALLVISVALLLGAWRRRRRRFGAE